jgi:hypothetical protein
VSGTALARDIAHAELGVPLRALRYVASGFRAPQPAGSFAYDAGGNTPLMLGAIAILALPELAALDLLLWHAPAWRIASDVLHAYAIVWSLGLAEAFRTLPHVIQHEQATFRTLFLNEVSVMRSAIERVEIVATGRRTARREMRFGAGFRQPAIRVTLRAPATARVWLGRARPVSTFLVAADDPVRLADALRP